MKNLEKIELNLNKKNKCGLALQSHNHRARGDYNAKFIFSPLKIILKSNIKIAQHSHFYTN